MIHLSFKRHRVPSEVIGHAVRLCSRFSLSTRDIEKMLAERGLDVSYETVRSWFLKVSPGVAANFRSSRLIPSDHWRLDERVLLIRGKRRWLLRAVDNEGEVLDFLVQSRRDARAARRLMRKLLNNRGSRRRGW
jgi:putative transposase